MGKRVRPGCLVFRYRVDAEDADADAVLVFNAADRKAKTKMAQKAHRAFERAKAREARRVSLGAEAKSSESESDSDSEDFADARMAELVDAGFDQDDQASAARLGEHRRLGREEAKLRGDLAELLNTATSLRDRDFAQDAEPIQL